MADCKYNLKQRKGWCKLHIVIDKANQRIITSALTTNHVGDVTSVPELLNRINASIASVTADGAYDIEQVYKTIAALNAAAIIPPKENATLTNYCIENMSARAANINSLNNIGRQKWHKFTGYNLRSLVESVICRYKKIIGTMVYSKKIENQKIESKIGCYILNKMTGFVMPGFFTYVANN